MRAVIFPENISILAFSGCKIRSLSDFVCNFVECALPTCVNWKQFDFVVIMVYNAQKQCILVMLQDERIFNACVYMS